MQTQTQRQTKNFQLQQQLKHKQHLHDVGSERKITSCQEHWQPRKLSFFLRKATAVVRLDVVLDATTASTTKLHTTGKSTKVA